MTLILGINATFFEPAIALIQDNKVLAAIEEERFTGIKHGRELVPFFMPALPYRALHHVFDRLGITIDDIDYLAYSFDATKFEGNMSGSHSSDLFENGAGYLDRRILQRHFNLNVNHLLLENVPSRLEMRNAFLTYGSPKWQFIAVEHQFAHAASSFLSSGFDNAAILSIDGIGEYSSTLFAHGNGRNINRIKEIIYPNSLGFFFEEITKFLGFQRNNDEYKVMALAAYGRPRYFGQLQKVVQCGVDGNFTTNINYEKSGNYGSDVLAAILGNPRIWGGEINERHADIAASAQAVLEDVVLNMLRWLHRKSGSRNLCLSGGVALNCVMNERIRQEGPFERIFIQPAAYDAGTALGAALYVNHYILGNPREYVMDSVYLGPEFSAAETEERLERCKIPYVKPSDIAATVAGLLADGKVVGWFQGKMEFGPRALGNRSILADPREPTMKDLVNSIKGREEFRPLAPSILEECAPDFFEVVEPSPFMLFARTVKPSKRNLIPAVVHVDGTARVQTVSEDRNRPFHDLIKAFYNLTGVPLVINTSFNYKAKPIVCNVDQALECFVNSGLDCVALGPFLVTK